MGTCIHEDKFYIITEFVKNDNLKTVLSIFILNTSIIILKRIQFLIIKILYYFRNSINISLVDNRKN